MLLVVGRLIHFLGFALAIGACFGAMLAFRSSATGEVRFGIDRAAAAIVTKVELVGAFVALFGGILLVVANPSVLDPAASGAGPWLHVKLMFVFGALVLAHVRMFNLQRLCRAHEDPDAAELAAMRKKGQTLDLVAVALYGLVLVLVLTRFVVFA